MQPQSHQCRSIWRLLKTICWRDLTMKHGNMVSWGGWNRGFLMGIIYQLGQSLGGISQANENLVLWWLQLGFKKSNHQLQWWIPAAKKVGINRYKANYHTCSSTRNIDLWSIVDTRTPIWLVMIGGSCGSILCHFIRMQLFVPLSPILEGKQLETICILMRSFEIIVTGRIAVFFCCLLFVLCVCT